MGVSYNSGVDNIYCYPNSNILKNKLNILDQDKLANFEREITGAALVELIKSPCKGNFDKKHLQSIHKFLFQDIYDWAGIFREVDIAKGNLFCRVIFLDSMAEDIFLAIKEEGFLIGMKEETVFTKLSEYMGDLNALHPFREGNGRTQREFISLLAQATGYKLNYSLTSSKEMMNASIKSFNCDYSGFEKIFREIAEPMTIDEQHSFLKAVSKEGLKVFNELNKNNLLPDRTKKSLDSKIDKTNIDNVTSKRKKEIRER